VRGGNEAGWWGNGVMCCVPGDKDLLQAVAKSASASLGLKLGARVIVTRNCQVTVIGGSCLCMCMCMKMMIAMIMMTTTYAQDLYNGMTGAVVALDRARVAIVLDDTNCVVNVTPEVFGVCGSNGVQLASRTQIPLALGWAISQHKAQGLSLSQGTCDLQGWGDSHQAYVAISRFRKLERAVIHRPRINEMNVKFAKAPVCTDMLHGMRLRISERTPSTPT
jgi:ATP-dependent exoDNAse (exonuclease V) alpha subunit